MTTAQFFMLTTLAFMLIAVWVTAKFHESERERDRNAKSAEHWLGKAREAQAQASEWKNEWIEIQKKEEVAA